MRSLRHVAPILVFAAMPLAAQSPTPGSTPLTIDACYVPASGTIYRIDTPASPAAGAPKNCLNVTHVRFTWNQQGPAGPQGPVGPAGPQGPSGTATIGPDLTLPGTLSVGTASLLNGLVNIGTPAGTSPGTQLLQLRDGPSGSGNLVFGVTPLGALTTRTLSVGSNATITGQLSATAGLLSGAGILASGTQAQAVPTGAGTRFLWAPQKAAIRAGQVTGAEWDDANLGAQSTAFGFNTTASGLRSTALGASASTNGKRGATVIGDDAASTPLLANVDHEFAVRASGGVRLRTAADLSKGCDIDVSGNLNCTGTVAGAAPTQHAALGGLTADDHPQYLRTGGTRPADGPMVIDGSANTRNLSLPRGGGTRFIWDPVTGSLRAGTVTGPQWNQGQLGTNSFASGYDASAAGMSAVALGTRTSAGDESLAFGKELQASGGSVLMGHNASSNGFAGAMVLSAGRTDLANAPVAEAARDEELLVRAPGGIRLRSNRSMTQGCDISPTQGRLDCSGGVRLGNSITVRIGAQQSVVLLNSAIVTASCPAGTVVIGGGVETAGGDMKVRESYPDFGNNRYVAQVRNDSPAFPGFATASAVCLLQ